MRIAEFRRAVGFEFGTDAARRRDPAGFAELLDRVPVPVIRLPLPKLQRVGRSDPFGAGFLYRIGWADEVSASRVRRTDFDDRIHLRQAWGSYWYGLPV